MEDEHERPLQPRTQIQGRVLLLTICAAGIGGTFQFGYNLSIINAPTLHIQEFTNETWQMRTGRPLPDHLVLLVWSLIVSLYPLGGLLGALLAGPLAVKLGRKKSLLASDVFVVAAAPLFAFSRRAGSFEMVMLGRLLVGVSAGVSMNVQPMYLGESAPKELRGAVAMTSAIFTALGILMGQVVGLRELLGGPQDWPLLLASCLVPGVLQLASLPLLPESPRFLFIDRGDSEACLAALRRLRGPADLAEELAELQRERAACRGRRARRPWELFRERALRRQVASLVVLGGAMELCGNDACVVIERVGRRVLLLAGYGLMTCWGSVFTAALCLQSSFPWMPYLAMSCIFASILSFGVGPAGVTGILATELFDQMARPAACVVCGALMWSMLFLVGLTFPFIAVSLPGPAPGGPAIGFVPVSTRTPGEPPSRECETEGDGAYLSQEDGVPYQDLWWAFRVGVEGATQGLGSLLTHRRAYPTSSMCLSCVSVSVGPSTLASSSPRPEARASWRSQRNCTDSTSPGGARAPCGWARRSSSPQSSSPAGAAGAPLATALPTGP
ncbi:solute carrier family 2, facilitated glucose transporter member 11 isoform X3 [Hippopotamus amphibius kiboko]|uniref:solute carrier family 2, facilitated glucose transporter member 11 isoform X3 n=1 Tax=Hippopotamus amphibius kiboko TaxID=575201 RepID=UPI002598DD9A|nr:solute carrier family 2, facilitated glucose transporter member 11 isoform X3 [Hippopotamus amphibius kiboko]